MPNENMPNEWEELGASYGRSRIDLRSSERDMIQKRSQVTSDQLISFRQGHSRGMATDVTERISNLVKNLPPVRAKQLVKALDNLVAEYEINLFAERDDDE